MGSCAAPSAKGDDKFITTDYLQQCRWDDRRGVDTGRSLLSAQGGTYIGVDWNNDTQATVVLATATAYDLSPFQGDKSPSTTALQSQTITGSTAMNKLNVDSGNSVVSRPRNIAFNYIVRSA
ncbi:hypothetical protein NVE83_05470 [Escherichia coli]|uniref:hypothetical protein n=1 Tax=Escherichia coli TaxID=562 RepID=UPI0029C54CF2|nr:hypothetical protein [Escherichia coli]MDX5544824.1 hypothetical protein [Escherichia coli]